MKTFLNLLILIISIPVSISGSFYQFDGKQLILDNGSVRRIIELPGDTVMTKSFFISGNERNFLRNRSSEFQFAANDRILNGYSGWKVTSCHDISDKNGGQGVLLKLKGVRLSEGIELEIAYLTYPSLPLIRKRITFINTSLSFARAGHITYLYLPFRFSLRCNNSKNWHSRFIWILYCRDYGRGGASLTRENAADYFSDGLCSVCAAVFCRHRTESRFLEEF